MKTLERHQLTFFWFLIAKIEHIYLNIQHNTLLFQSSILNTKGTWAVICFSIVEIERLFTSMIVLFYWNCRRISLTSYSITITSENVRKLRFQGVKKQSDLFNLFVSSSNKIKYSFLVAIYEVLQSDLEKMGPEIWRRSLRKAGPIFSGHFDGLGRLKV